MSQVSLQYAANVVHRIYYEQPLNERTRTFLRLEHLFDRASHHAEGNTTWDSRAVLGCLLDIINLFGRSDLKTEIIKELERHSNNLNRLAKSPGVDADRLTSLLDELHELHQDFLHQKGQVVADLRNNEFLAGIMQRSSIPGGTCSFDLPSFHHWLSLPDQQRQDDLQGWLDTFSLYSRAVNLILHLTRNSSTPTNETAADGFFTHSLDSSMPVQLIRVAVAPSDQHYPEISGGKHRFTVRFMRMDESGHPKKVAEDIHFEMTCCVI